MLVFASPFGVVFSARDMLMDNDAINKIAIDLMGVMIEFSCGLIVFLKIVKVCVKDDRHMGRLKGCSGFGVSGDFD
ncbi:hypothetical protein [Burkholderia ambifaria]|uniref:hypothetical protein n=1 Tax=Burkholderia ambifaria TaxID=152480 RepID=UPI001ABAB0BC|nr:hypothetical protein [Burkholderia ambifaria]